jgi:hypothetical protein
LKKSDYDVIDIICTVAIALVSIYLALGLVAAVVSGIQVANGETPIIAKACCCCETKNK